MISRVWNTILNLDAYTILGRDFRVSRSWKNQIRLGCIRVGLQDLTGGITCLKMH